MEIKQAFLDRVIRPLRVDEDWYTFFEKLIDQVDLGVLNYLKIGIIPINFTVPLDSPGLEYVAGNYYKVLLALPTAKYSINTEGWVFVSEDVEMTDLDYKAGSDLFIRFLGETPETDSVQFTIKDYPTNFEFGIKDGLPFQFLPGSYYNLYFAAALCKAHLVFPYDPESREYKLRSAGASAVRVVDKHHLSVPDLNVPPHVGVIYDRLRIYRGASYIELVIKSIDGDSISLMQENPYYEEENLSYSLIRTYDSFLTGQTPEYINVILDNFDLPIGEFTSESILATKECEVTLYKDYYLNRASANIAMSRIGGSVATGVDTNGTLLVAGLPDWLHYDSLNNTFSMDALPDTLYVRKAIIDFVVREKPELHTTVTVGQYNYYVLFENDSLSVTAQEQEINPGISTNGTLIITEKPDWVIYDATTGKFKVTRNEDTVNPRSGVVTCGIEESGSSSYFTVWQDRLFYMNLNKTSDSVQNVAGTRIFLINTNAEVTVTSNVAWARVTKSVVSATQLSILVTYDENVPQGAQRQARITCKSSKSYVGSTTYVLTQAASIAQYSNITANLSYEQISAAGGQQVPNLAYSQTWGWNDSITDAGTITSGAGVEYNFMILDPVTGQPTPVTEVPFARINQQTGIIEWQPNQTDQNRTVTVRVGVAMNGKSTFTSFIATQLADALDYKEFFEPVVSLSQSSYNFTENGGSLDIGTLVSFTQAWNQHFVSGKVVPHTQSSSGTISYSIVGTTLVGFSLSGATFTSAANQTTNARGPQTVRVQVSNEGKSGYAELQITQSAGYKTYSAITANLSYPQAVPSAISSVPEYSYSQTWGWNGSTTGGGTITSGAVVQFSAGVVPEGVTVDSSTGVVRWPAPNEGALEQANVSMLVRLNGKQKTVNAVASRGADAFDYYTYSGLVATMQNASVSALSQSLNLANLLSYSQTRTAHYLSGKTVDDIINVGATTQFTINGELVGSTWTVPENKSTSARTFNGSVTVTLNGESVTKTFTISQAAGTKTYSAISLSFSYPRVEPNTLVQEPSYSYTQTWGWNGSTTGGGTITSGAILVFSLETSGAPLSLNTSTGVVTWNDVNEGTLQSADVKLKVTLNGKQKTVTASAVRGADSVVSVEYFDLDVATTDKSVNQSSHSENLLDRVNYSQTKETTYLSGKVESETITTGATVSFVKVSGSGLTISDNIATIAENKTTSARSWQVQVTVELNGETKTETFTISQSAGYKTYSEITASFSYQDAQLVGDTIQPSVSYRQTWGWNGSTTGGGTITSGASLQFSCVSLPGDCSLNSSTGVITWGAVSEERQVTVSMQVSLNSKTKTVEAVAKQSSATIISTTYEYQYNAAFSTYMSQVRIPASGGSITLEATAQVRSRAVYHWSDNTTTYGNWGNWDNAGLTFSKISGTGFTLSGDTLTAADRETTIGVARYAKVRVTNNLDSSTYDEINIYQDANVITYGNITRIGTPVFADIPASGGSVSSGDFSNVTFYQSVSYTSGVTQSIPISPDISFGTISAASRGTVVGGRVKVGRINTTYSANGVIVTEPWDIWQEHNWVTGSLSYTGAPGIQDIPASGGSRSGSDVDYSEWVLLESAVFTSGDTATNTTLSCTCTDSVTKQSLGTTVKERTKVDTFDIEVVGLWSTYHYSLDVYQQANQITWGGFDLSGLTLYFEDIPASGGTRSASSDVLTDGILRQYKYYTSGESQTVVVTPTFSGGQVYVSSRVNNIGPRVEVSEVNVNVTANDVTETVYVPVYQQANRVEAGIVEYTGYIGIDQIPASGGTVGRSNLYLTEITPTERYTFTSGYEATNTSTFSYSSNTCSADSLGTTVKARSKVGTVEVTITGLYGSTTVSVDVYQEANSASWGALDISDATIKVDDIPASGAQTSVSTAGHIGGQSYQYKNYTSGAFERVQVYPTLSGSAISTTSRGTVEGARIKLSTQWTVNVTANGVTTTVYRDVYQEANVKSLTSATYTGSSWSNSSLDDVPASGGSRKILNLSVTLLLTYNYTSGATSSESDSNALGNSSSVWYTAHGSGFGATQNSRYSYTGTFDSRGTVEGEARSGYIQVWGYYGGVYWTMPSNTIEIVQAANRASWTGGSFSVSGGQSIPASGGSCTYSVTKPTAVSFTSGSSITSGITVQVMFDSSYPHTGFTLSNSSGSGTITASANTSTNSRSCMVLCYAYCGSRTTQLGYGTIVTQYGNGTDASLSISPTSKRSSVSQFDITVTSNASWTAQSSTSLITLSRYSGHSGTVTLTVNNTSNTTGRITFYVSGTLKATCTISAGAHIDPFLPDDPTEQMYDIQ